MLCSLTVIFLNCNKEVDTQIWNYYTFTDSRDGKTYKYIKIGTQEWMAENLAFKTASGSWNIWDDETYGAKYGRLYTWEAAKQAVPNGWHLPTDAEWKQLEMAHGMSQSDADGIEDRGTNEGYKLKAASGWHDNTDKTTGNGADVVGFNALPGGMRTNSGTFFGADWYGYWWSATESDYSKAWMRRLTERSLVFRNLSFKEDAYSVRCVKD